MYGFEDYIVLIKLDLEELDILVFDLLIGVISFYWDLVVFDDLKD